MNKKEEIIQMLKDNPIKIIKCGDIEIPVEYLKQTTVNVNGNDYIRLQQENKHLKNNWNNLKEYLNEGTFYYKTGNGEYTTEMVSNRINGLDTLRKMQELEKGDSNE